MTFLHKFGLLLWKNMKMIQRHWLITTFEMLIPIGLFTLLAWIKSHVPPDTVVVEKPATFVDAYTVDMMTYLFPSSTVLLYYAPANNFTTKLMESVRLNLAFSRERLIPVSSESELETLHNLLYENSTINGIDMIGVIFEEQDEVPKNFKYKIRSSHSEWRTTSLFPEYQHPGPMESAELYFRSGFMALQYMIDASYLNMVKAMKNISDTNGYPYVVQEFPYPAYTEPSASSVVFSILSLFINFGFIISLSTNLLKQIVADKKTGVTELMKLMGLTRWMLWLTWLLKILMVNIVVITVIVLLLTVPINSDAGSFIQYSNGFLFWIFLVLYCIASTVFMFFISTLFYRPVLATCFGALVWSASYFTPKELLTAYKSSSLVLKLLSAIFPNMAMHWGFSVMGTFESAQIGANWSNLCKSPSGSANELTMGHVLLMLIVDILFYGLLTAYTDAIFPGYYGVSQPWNFFCTKSFWQNRKVGVTQTAYGSAEEIQKNFEAPMHGLKPGIRIKNLRKVYDSGKVAVDGVTLDIYQDQITALLGHNGAGKTTTMSILTGMLPPTSGSIYINDYDIRYDLAKVRESLGLCPQHDMLFNELTVMEHLIFFGMLKGLSREKATREANVLLKQIHLEEKAHSMSSQLSGGMKRKVSLGIALIGGSKVVILDEPTSGLDPEARRQIWDLLLSMRGHRTIVITTHFMEEADVLGDRIAIMDHGRVQCYGTSLFLKNQYGAGYMLKLMVQERCDIDNVTQIVKSVVSNASMKSKLGTELSYTLPSEQKSHYPKLFDAIENNKDELGIASIGVSITTMEEVFLKVGKMASDDNNPAGNQLQHLGSLSRSSSLVSLEGKPPRGPVWFQQLEAVFIKKLLFMYRKWIMLCILAIIPIMMTAAALKLGLLVMSVDRMSEPSLTISLAEYGATDVLYHVPPDGPVGLARCYVDIVKAAGSTPISVPEPVVSDEIVDKNETVLSNALIKVGDQDISHFRENLIVAAMFGVENGSAMFSSIAYHGASISVNLMNNAILRLLTNSTDFSITTTNHPLKYEPIKKRAPAEGVAATLQQFIPLATLYFLGYFLVFPLLERVSSAKQLQLMTGLSPLTYWIPCFLCDFFVFTLVALLMVLMVPLVDTYGYFGGSEEMGVFILLLMMYGLSGIPFAYVFSYLAKTYSNGFGLFVGLNFVIGSIVPWVVVLLEVLWISESSTSSFVNVFKKILFLLPQFSFSYGLNIFFKQAVLTNACHAMTSEEKNRLCSAIPYDECCGEAVKTVSYLGLSNEHGEEGIGWPLLFLYFDTILYIGILMLVDYGIVAYVWEGVKKLTRQKKTQSEDEIDGDVKIEYTRVKSGDSDILTVNDLAKVYGWQSLVVKGISFGVMPGECFGLLGVNGAGKTTTFKMLTGAEIPTEGDARIDHRKLSKHRAEYLSQIGYCPQFDAFNETLTGREMLQLFARLRGVPKEDVDSEVERWLKLLDLNEYQDCRCGTYSGGNKRKLSTAMALIGDPPLIFLDEPTSGVDPVARRNLWSVLAKIQKTNHSIVLTSHSMEECEALCNRLAIMVKGQFVCIGENQYLKQKFGQGFTVMIKLKDVEAEGNQVTNVQKDVEKMFPDCVIKDKHQGLLHYHLTDPRIPWKVLFSNMEKLNADHVVIEDYTISETTLEQLFLAFAQAGEGNTTESRV